LRRNSTYNERGGRSTEDGGGEVRTTFFIVFVVRGSIIFGGDDKEGEEHHRRLLIMGGMGRALALVLVALALSLASSSTDTERVYGESFSDLMFTEPEEWGISADVFVPYHSEVVWIAYNNTTKAGGFHIWKFPVWVGCVVKVFDNDGSTEVVIHADEFTVGKNQYLLVEMNNSWFWLGVVTWEGVSHDTVLKTSAFIFPYCTLFNFSVDASHTLSITTPKSITVSFSGIAVFPSSATLTS